ncbi:MAG: DNA polymerase III subunit epsilon [Hyphomicrobiaceae bacterium]|nr:DNA polymerase III subunit epsilon [Hyphomicrobiaceae bacterium]MCC0007405.1 DNA polymerase III subunit epsilon [Hyphomicrobiaceae bacterium]
MREIVLDTETTGLNANRGDRLIEIGCIELINRIPTGREYHVYINPERDVPKEAEDVHGLSTQFLLDKPVFKAVAQDFLDFIADDPLVIHNATFDVGFLNAELARLQLAAITMDRVVDTLQLARRKHPAGPNSLDALCKRYGIDNSQRIKHGALMDSLLLADVYIELLGERQATLVLADTTERQSLERGGRRGPRQAAQRPAPLPPRVTQEMKAAHRAFVETLGGGSPIWLKYLPEKVS